MDLPSQHLLRGESISHMRGINETKTKIALKVKVKCHQN